MKAKSHETTLDPHHSLDDGDDLTHKFCGNCWRRAEVKGWKRQAFCGATGAPLGDGKRPPGTDDCVVCIEMTERPCRICGYIPVG